MKRTRLIILACSAAACIHYGCIAEQGIDKSTFASLDRTSQALRSALTTSRPCDVPRALQDELANGIVAVGDRAKTKAERDLMAAYAQVLATYRDGLLLCGSRGHLAQMRLIPKGRIFVTQELDPIIRKYGLPSEKHVYKPTGQHMESLDGNAIEVIWDRARAQIKIAENILHYH